MSDGEIDALAGYIRDAGGQVVIYSDAPAAAAAAVGRLEDEGPLLRFWTDYSDIDRQRILTTVGALNCARVTCSDPVINAIMRASGDEQILDLVNYNYEPRKWTACRAFAGLASACRGRPNVPQPALCCVRDARNGLTVRPRTASSSCRSRNWTTTVCCSRGRRTPRRHSHRPPDHHPAGPQHQSPAAPQGCPCFLGQLESMSRDSSVKHQVGLDTLRMAVPGKSGPATHR